MKKMLAAYEQMGWRLTPCGSNGNGKAPQKAGWQNDALTKGAAETHLKQGGTVALVLGPGSGVVDLETDAPEGEQEVVALFDGAVPKGPAWKSRRGVHRLFQFDPRLSALRKSVIHVGSVELRGCSANGACSIVPPSVVDGVKREWIVAPGKVPIPSLPEPVVAKLLRANTPGASLSAKDGEKIREGHRNTFLAGLAGSMRRAGMSAEEMEPTLQEVNARRCRPPLPKAEVSAMAKGMERYEPAQPSLFSFFSFFRTRREEWPTLDPLALSGMAGEVVQTIEPFTEADPVALLLHFLAAFGCMVGPGPHCRVVHDRHPAKLFALLVGQTAKGRKGLSWGSIRRLIELAEPAFLEQIVTGLSTGEGLVARLQAQEFDGRILAIEPEFGGLLIHFKREGNILSPVLREAWDQGDLHVVTRKNPLHAVGTHVAMVGHVTVEELQSHLTYSQAACGFGNRILFAMVRRSKELPEGAAPPEAEMAKVAIRVKKSLTFAKRVDLVQRDEKAKELWASVYPELTEGRPGLYGAVTSRAEAQVLRLSLIYALLDRSRVITEEHLRSALALWRYCDASAGFIFGHKTGNTLADKLYSFLQQGDQTMTAISDYLGRNKTEEEIDRALATLESAGLVRSRVEKTRGRPRILWGCTN